MKAKQTTTPTGKTQLLTVKQAALYLGVCERSFYNYTKPYGGSIPIVKLSVRCNRVDIADLEAFIEGRKRGCDV